MIIAERVDDHFGSTAAVMTQSLSEIITVSGFLAPGAYGR